MWRSSGTHLLVVLLRVARRLLTSPTVKQAEWPLKADGGTNVNICRLPPKFTPTVRSDRSLLSVRGPRDCVRTDAFIKEDDKYQYGLSIRA